MNEERQKKEQDLLYVKNAIKEHKETIKGLNDWITRLTVLEGRLERQLQMGEENE